MWYRYPLYYYNLIAQHSLISEMGLHWGGSNQSVDLLGWNGAQWDLYNVHIQNCLGFKQTTPTPVVYDISRRALLELHYVVWINWHTLAFHSGAMGQVGRQRQRQRQRYLPLGRQVEIEIFAIRQVEVEIDICHQVGRDRDRGICHKVGRGRDRDRDRDICHNTSLQ